MPDFTLTPLNKASEPPHRISRKVFKWLVILAAILAGVSVLLFFFGSTSFTESKVLLTVDGPTQASVGDEVIYKVHYENKTNTTLNNLKLSINYPENSVIVKDGQVMNNPGNVQTISEDNLAPGKSKDLEFHSFLVGDRGNIKVAKVKLMFEAGNLKSRFEKDAQLSTTISDVPVALTLVGPPTAVSGQSVTYMLDYRNQSSNDISDLQLILSYPDGFIPTKITPAATSGANTWSLPVLKAGTGNRITVTGTLSGKESESKAISVALKRNIDNTYVDYEKTGTTTVISSPLLNLNTTVNGSSDYISHAADTLNYQVNYQNASTYTFNGLVLAVKLEGSMYDFNTVDPKGGFYDSSTHTITWNSTVVPNFISLTPRTSGLVNFSIKLRPSVSGTGSGSLFAHAGVQLVTQNVPDAIQADQISTTNDLVTKITSQPTFRTALYYSDAAFGSSGPMPPRANQETSFTVHWQVVNPGNQLDNAKIVGTLPQGVTWKNVVSVGSGQAQPTFNKNTSQVTWNLGSLPAGVGVNGVPTYELVFQISVKPSPTQTGSAALLVSNTSLSGVDSFTKENIVVNVSDLTTNSTVDQSGNGIVQ
jgi:hypothetical protein